MKVSVRQYAQSLFEIVVDKSETEAKEIIARFIDFLYHRQDLNKAEAIIAELEKLYVDASGEVIADLASARPLTAAAKQQIAAYLEKRIQRSAKFVERLEPSLLGGFVLNCQGLVIDGSLKNNLQKFKKQLSN